VTGRTWRRGGARRRPTARLSDVEAGVGFPNAADRPRRARPRRRRDQSHQPDERLVRAAFDEGSVDVDRLALSRLHDELEPVVRGLPMRIRWRALRRAAQSWPFRLPTGLRGRSQSAACSRGRCLGNPSVSGVLRGCRRRSDDGRAARPGYLGTISAFNPVKAPTSSVPSSPSRRRHSPRMRPSRRRDAPGADVRRPRRPEIDGADPARQERVGASAA